MALTDINQVSEQVQKKWAPLFMQELREQLLLGSLVNKDYEGSIGAEGDTVYVSQINAPQGSLKTVGTDADTFDSELLSTSRVPIQANKRAVAAFEIADTAKLMSQLDSKDSEIRQSLLYAVSKQINDYLYSLVSASSSAPDHLISGVSDFNASQVSALRVLAGQAKWMKNKPWTILADPVYHGDLLNAATLTSADYVNDKPVVGGQMGMQRFGFNIFEDNSLPADHALAFHPDFLGLVMQYEPRFKISDLHSQKKFGMLMSVDIVFGASQLIDGDVKHIQVYNSAWNP